MVKEVLLNLKQDFFFVCNDWMIKPYMEEMV